MTAQVRSLRRALEGRLQHAGRGVGGQVGPDGHRPQLEEWRQDSGLRWQDSIVICCCLACIKSMLQGSIKGWG